MNEDKITLARISLLHPALRSEARTIYQECCQALTGKYTLRFTHTFRSFTEQNQLYAKGRTQPGNIVTWAKAGHSYHNYGLAIDICLISRNFKEVSWQHTQDFDTDGIADWMECVHIFEKYGWEWGGRWSKPKTDIPHFQKTFNKKIQQLLAQKNNGTYPSLV